tara:strand:+ start:489 stop:602 length:114 start_codon:yes stop_codon:yes gene_type:complete
MPYCILLGGIENALYDKGFSFHFTDQYDCQKFTPTLY